MEKRADEFNTLIVDVFNQALKREEERLSDSGFPDLTMREFHVIEAACAGGDNSAGAVAKRLWITAGTLSTAAAVLEKKGYIVRERDAADRRIIRMVPTEKGVRANEAHRRFHEKLAETVLGSFTAEETEALFSAIGGISRVLGGENKGDKIQW